MQLNMYFVNNNAHSMWRTLYKMYGMYNVI